MADLFDARLELDDLAPDDLGPYVPEQLSDAGKQRVWDRYHAGSPTRVPVELGLNNRLVMLDRRIDTGELTYKQVFSDAVAMLRVQLHWQYVCRKRYHLFCDYPSDLPETWQVALHLQNIYEAAFFGCPVDFKPDQVPDTTPVFDGENKRAIFDIDITRPFERYPYKTAIEFYEILVDYVKGKTFLGRPVAIDRPAFIASDGPLTVAMNVRGPEILTDLIDDPDYAGELFAFTTEAALRRREAFIEYADLPETAGGFADDSIALISVEQYKEMILPHHRTWYDRVGVESGKRAIHLCGDATRHFPVLTAELGVTSFDTGFPVAFAELRKELGPEVEIHGGVEVALLLDGTPEQVYQRGREILRGGVMEGGRFVLREANNLPPNVPWANLAAMYKSAFDFGRYE